MADGPEKKHLRLGPLLGQHESVLSPQRATASLNVVFGEEGFGRRPGRALLFTIPGAGAILDVAQYVWRGNRKTLALTVLADVTTVRLLNESNGTWAALVSPSGANMSWAPSKTSTCLMFNGFLVIALPSGDLIAYDGADLVNVLALQGTDASGGILGARAYLYDTPKATVLALWRSRLVAFNGTLGYLSAYEADPNIPISAPLGGPNVWPADTRMAIVTANDDEVLASTVRRDRLELYTRAGIFVLDEDEFAPTIRSVEAAHGIIAPRSLQNLGEISIYLGLEAVHAFDGSATVDISGPIRRTLAKVNWTAARDAVSAHHKTRREYWLWLPLSGETVNSFAVVYDYRRKEWRVAAGQLLSVPSTQGPSWRVTCARVVVTEQGEQLLLTGSDTPKIYREEVGEDDGGLVFPAFVVLPTVGEAAGRIAWGNTRIRSVADGSFVDLYTLIHGEDPESVYSRSPDAELRALQDGTALYDSPLPITNPSRQGAILNASIAQVAEEQAVLISLPGERDLQPEPAPGCIRWVEFAWKAREGRSP